ncbi:MAG: hypothetical protein H6736_11695 [Alphaproteobacteria bacterium]|nr:hypothetical protein [Alphaproteobacteria bacterium]MCB9692466.1 hypothetical protein [Alphaproteobacteria bacterium]
MSDDYYSYRPRVALDKPVALVGFPGARVVTTARVAAMITGLETVLLPHQVAHRAGRHPEALLLAGENVTLHSAELELLERAGRKRHAPLLALGATTLDDPENLAWVRRTCRIVHLHQTLREAVQAIAAEREEDPRKHAHLALHGGYGEEELASIYGLRTGLFERIADLTVPVASRSPLEVGRSLPDALGWVTS